MRIALWLSSLVALGSILACGTPTATPTELSHPETHEQSPAAPAEQSARETPETATATSTRPPVTDTPKPTAATPAEQPATEIPDPPVATPPGPPATEIPERPAATPAEQPATETPERPVATPPGPPATEAPERPAATPAEQPATDSPSNQPGALLAKLPAGASQFIFVDIEAATERSAFRESVEFQLGHFVNLDEIPFAEELLRSIGVSAMALGDFYTGSEWACILSGDFALVQGALRLAAAVDSGGGLSAGMIDAHRDVEIFSLVRNTSRSEIQVYLAIPDRKTLAASQDLELVKEIIDRQRDGLSLPQSFAVMLEDWGHPDYLDALRLGSDPNLTLPGPLSAAKYHAFHATLGENATTTMRVLQQFSDDDQAAIAAAWLGEQEDPVWRSVGYGNGAEIDQWRAKGQSVYGEANVADEDVLGLIQPN